MEAGVSCAKNVVVTDDADFDDFHENYSLGAILGRGGFGTVYAAVRNRDGLAVAVKHILKSRVQSWGSVGGRLYPKEVCLLLHLARCRRVIDLLDCFEKPDSYLLVLEYPDNCMDLFDYISMRGPLDEKTARHIFTQVVETILECEALGVVHRDIKDENILLSTRSLTVKLIDLGAGVFLHEDQHVPFDGTGVYAPPELLLSGIYSRTASTAWSLGILLFNMLVGDIPFHTFAQICNIELRFPDNLISESAKDLISCCLQRDPNARPDLRTLLSHDWLYATSCCACLSLPPAATQQQLEDEQLQDPEQ